MNKVLISLRQYQNWTLLALNLGVRDLQPSSSSLIMDRLSVPRGNLRESKLLHARNQMIVYITANDFNGLRETLALVVI